MSLGEAIETTDAATGSYPAHYMINCAHPTHFDYVLDGGAPWARRIGGLRANASTLSHAELDEMEQLDAGDPDDLARRLRRAPVGATGPPCDRRMLRHRITVTSRRLRPRSVPRECEGSLDSTHPILALKGVRADALLP